MKIDNSKQRYEIGMVGLGVMGRNLLLNMADQGFAVAGYDKDAAKVKALAEEGKEGQVLSTADIAEFIGFLRRRRAVMMLVPAGAPVDSVIKDLLPHLEPGDLIIDGGNSHFTDTDTRTRSLTARDIQFLGVGVSGGEEGARHGPSIMPGGSKDAYERGAPDSRSGGSQSEGRALCDVFWAWLGRTFREDGPQRHRIRSHAIDRGLL